MAKLTRRNFLAGSAIAAAAAGLAACDNGGGTEPAPEPEPEPAADIFAAPDASAYPIDPDGEDVAALWTAEVTRDTWTRVTADGAPELGIQDASKIIQVNGLAFKDLNGNGKLDLYEDWRQPEDVRAAALAEMMTAEEAMLLMWHGGDEAQMVPGAPVEEGAEEKPAHYLCIEGSRAGVSRLAPNPETFASTVAWINEVEALCEDSKFGVPYLCSTDQYQNFYIPDNCAIAAAMDKDVWRKAGMWLGRAWRASGIRCLLGPQVDVNTNPNWTRFSGSVCEDPAVNRDFAAAFTGGMQSSWGDNDATDDQGWGTDSVIGMLKHFVGGCCAEGGRNDHFDNGKYDVFPGDNFEAHLIPFLDGGLHLDSITGQMAAVMPNYGISYSEDGEYGELVGGAYNARQLAILRNAGWDGMFTTDWGIMSEQIFGVEALSQPERYKKMLEAGSDQYGGGFMPEVGKETIAMMNAELGEEETTKRFRESAARFIKVMMLVDLFENPYADREQANKVMHDEAAHAFGLEASEKSIVMLKNAGGVISADGISGKVYIPQVFTPGSMGMFGATPASAAPSIDPSVFEGLDIVTDTVGEPTGPEGELQESDVVRLTADELKDVACAVVKIGGPKMNAYSAGVTGGAMGANKDIAPVEYEPISLQYRPYTADAAREVSLAGDVVAAGDEAKYVSVIDGKENRSYKGKTVMTDNEGDLDFVIGIKQSLPETAKLICCVEANNPMCFHELEPYCDVIFFCFTMSDKPSPQAYANFITGKTEPSAVLPDQMPKDMAAVETQMEDVPRDMDCYVDSEGNAYDFCFGLNWSGVIDDERTAKYKAAPLTKPETPVIYG